MKRYKGSLDVLGHPNKEISEHKEQLLDEASMKVGVRANF